MEDENVVLEIITGDEPREVARRVASIVIGSRDIVEKNAHCWFFGENHEWVLVRITNTRFELRYLDGFTNSIVKSLKESIEWIINET